ncbi:MAG: hypothetical protein WCB85_05010 [Candidatus Dormiibacterota bacterium]
MPVVNRKNFARFAVALGRLAPDAPDLPLRRASTSPNFSPMACVFTEQTPLQLDW